MSAGLVEVLRAYHEERSHAASLVRERHSLAYVSDALACQRKRVYSARGVEATDPPDGRALEIMALGDTIHETVQAALAQALGDRIVIEHTIRDGRRKGDGLHTVGGRLDAYIPVVDEEAAGLMGAPDDVVGHACAIEIKSMAGYGFRLCEKSGEPKPEHVAQGVLGAGLVGAPWLWLVYRSRDTLATQSWLIEVDPVEVGRLRALSYEVAIAYDASTTPPREVEGKPVGDPAAPTAPWQCRYCVYRTHCAQDEQ